MTFSDFKLPVSLQKALDETGYTQPTSIQHKTFSVVMSGRDVCGIAQTGTGKTAAYLLPILKQFKFTKERHPQTLIIVPTRELAVQVTNEAKRLGQYMNLTALAVYGGVNLSVHRAEVEQGMDILVATPGRLLDLIYCGSLRTKAIKKLVIDEVDEMLNLGFRSQLKSVLETLPEKRQNLLFSATMTDEVELLIEDYFNNPVRIEAAPAGTPLEKIKQIVYRVPNFNTKVNLLELILQEDTAMIRVLLFVATKKLADELFLPLSEKFPEQVGVIHSNKEQNFRFNAVNKFKAGETKILIATDIIARGLDIDDVSHVICFDTPEVAENYIHRIGRTGRADKNGTSITFVADNETEHFEAIEALMQTAIAPTALPASLVISTVLTEDEIPKIRMKHIPFKIPKGEGIGAAFHEKSEKNKKVNVKVSHKDKMFAKYGKPKARKPKK